MLCDICNKKKATVHLTEIVDEQMLEMHLCEECAREKSVQMEQQFGLSDLLAGLADFGKQAKENDQEKLTCAHCGLSYEEFKKLGRLGCSECYSAFEEHLAGLLKRIHGSNRHLGKAPQPQPAAPAGQAQPEGAVTVAQLKKQLHDAIAREDFERAAQLRDQIRSQEDKPKDAAA